MARKRSRRPNRAANARPPSRTAPRRPSTGLVAKQKKADRRWRLFLRIGAPIVVVVLVVGIFLAVKLTKSPIKSGPGEALTGPVPDSMMTELSSVPDKVSDSVGAGDISGVFTAIKGTPMTANGKPRILYIGAEYCPYCAAERWPMVVALSRFGTFSGLGMTYSATNDSAGPDTPTLTFHGASYTSKYVSFKAYEETTNQPDPNGSGYVKLDTVSSSDEKIMQKYSSTGSIPFVDFGNQLLISGASYDPKILANTSQIDIAKGLSDSGSAATKSIVGTANIITAGICTLTDDKPANVCSQAGVTAAASTLPS